MATVIDFATRERWPEEAAQIAALTDAGRRCLNSLVYTVQQVIATEYHQRRITLEDMIAIADLMLREER